LNFSHPLIREVAKRLEVDSKLGEEKTRTIYNFVKDDIKFGFNESDDIPASKVLQDGYGQCNTKASLFMALLRSVEIPCRIHFFSINKRVQKGILTGIHYRLTPSELIHSWTEVLHRDRWINLEGLILDNQYLQSLKKKFSQGGYFEGYGVAIDGFSGVSTEWMGDDTYVQSKLIRRDYGIFDSPDEFYRQHGTNLWGIKKFLFKYHIRKEMNRNTLKIRTCAGV
jgi:hypothetical protein